MPQATILDVAARAGVSKSLVSLVMHDSPSVSEGKRQAVLEAAAALGYRPNAVARSLVQRRTRVLGVMLSDLHNTFFADVLDGVAGRAGERGYKAMLNTGNRAVSGEAEAIETLLRAAQRRPDPRRAAPRCRPHRGGGALGTGGAGSENDHGVTGGLREQRRSRRERRWRSTTWWSWATGGSRTSTAARVPARRRGATGSCAPCGGTAWPGRPAPPGATTRRRAAPRA